MEDATSAQLSLVAFHASNNNAASFGLERQRFIGALSIYDVNTYFTGILSRMTRLNLLYLTSHLDMKTLEHVMKDGIFIYSGQGTSFT